MMIFVFLKIFCEVDYLKTNFEKASPIVNADFQESLWSRVASSFQHMPNKSLNIFAMNNCALNFLVLFL
jgi:hypothetical protein